MELAVGYPSAVCSTPHIPIDYVVLDKEIIGIAKISWQRPFVIPLNFTKSPTPVGEVDRIPVCKVEDAMIHHTKGCVV